MYVLGEKVKGRLSDGGVAGKRDGYFKDAHLIKHGKKTVCVRPTGVKNFSVCLRTKQREEKKFSLFFLFHLKDNWRLAGKR